MIQHVLWQFILKGMKVTFVLIQQCQPFVMLATIG